MKQKSAVCSNDHRSLVYTTSYLEIIPLLPWALKGYRRTLIEIEGEHGTDGKETDRQFLDGKGMCPGTQMLATHRYKNNPDGPVGKELDLSEEETLVYLMKHDDTDHWWLAENEKGQVGYVPVAYLMIIIYETVHEEESDTTRKEG